MEAACHPLQHERLAALHSFEILDTDPERDFDDIVKLAAATCGTSISVVNFIDAERQWFKAETGLGVRETPLATSICAHVILQDEFVEINDTLDDPRMRDNPLCCGDPGLRFYAGALLKTAEGLPLGTLCVLDYAPRTLTALQRDTLRVLARQVIALLESRKALRTADLLRLEVDHRVKNSLQALTAFARLQRRAFASEEAKLALSMILTRIDSLVHLHHQLYETNEHLAVELGEYIGRVCGHLRGIAPPGVILAVEADRIIVTADQAAAVGTYLNEFITNSFKHGFPNEREGTVTISLRLTEAGTACLRCSDDGIGLPPDLDPAPAGLGMKIAEIVCMELESALDLRSGPAGVVATLNFEPRIPTMELL
ncbi:histidine kinase dimerization/phosphoacceptor domain -containing protein [Thalassobaculum sp. OXR-137]|uniref:histidine kinase dimerization/phosphoacceptor domain -containing protein n=1 Tax=Thalassobaculum sp. OXR-137 TaxID=3100173 RepID=UPI002AC9279B|nr:histidine kinase dimerization/phosphoacceptor domain -containing protein [Thalassobaculum sp. OXR-137]WPZ35170.1 histidine kinase dimerization/phosphoacceptor domain -containing protein [Thalassobaculum sp. OXR-137]